MTDGTIFCTPPEVHPAAPLQGTLSHYRARSRVEQLNSSQVFTAPLTNGNWILAPTEQVNATISCGQQPPEVRKLTGHILFRRDQGCSISIPEAKINISKPPSQELPRVKRIGIEPLRALAYGILEPRGRIHSLLTDWEKATIDQMIRDHIVEMYPLYVLGLVLIIGFGIVTTRIHMTLTKRRLQRDYVYIKPA
jgi:hypothetical protein